MARRSERLAALAEKESDYSSDAEINYSSDSDRWVHYDNAEWVHYGSSEEDAIRVSSSSEPSDSEDDNRAFHCPIHDISDSSDSDSESENDNGESDEQMLQRFLDPANLPPLSLVRTITRTLMSPFKTLMDETRQTIQASGSLAAIGEWIDYVKPGTSEKIKASVQKVTANATRDIILEALKDKKMILDLKRHTNVVTLRGYLEQSERMPLVIPILPRELVQILQQGFDCREVLAESYFHLVNTILDTPEIGLLFDALNTPEMVDAINADSKALEGLKGICAVIEKVARQVLNNRVAIENFLRACRANPFINIDANSSQQVLELQGQFIQRVVTLSSANSLNNLAPIANLQVNLLKIFNKSRLLTQALADQRLTTQLQLSANVIGSAYDSYKTSLPAVTAEITSIEDKFAQARQRFEALQQDAPAAVIEVNAAPGILQSLQHAKRALETSSATTDTASKRRKKM